MRRNKVVLFLASILAFSATLAFGACENQEQGGTGHTCSYVEEKAEDEYLKSPATCEGKAVYYKSCVCGEASETDTFEYGNSLGHEYGEWLTNNDGTHSRYCDRDNAHSETKDCHGGAATCTEQATCEDCGTKYGELEEHSFTLEKAEDEYLKSPATCEDKAVYYKSCACGEASETETFEYGNSLGHEYGEWLTNNDGTHSRYCDRDNAHAETKDCHGGTATCTEQATCEDCGAKYGELEEHSFTLEKAEEKYLKSAATCTKKAVYYKSCVCGKASETDTFEHGELAEHSFTEEKAEEKYLKSAATCDTKAFYYKSCVCGEASKTDTFVYGEALKHNYSDWGGNGNGTHTKTCKRNGNHRITENCSGGTATCTEQARCSKCGCKYGELAAHDYENHVCKTCGKKQGDDLAFSLNDEGNGYVVTGIGSCKDTDLYIPETHEGLPVTSIGVSAFEACNSLTSVTIGNNVTSIGVSAFSRCSSLQYNKYDGACYLGNAGKPYLYLIDYEDDANRYSCNINEQCKVIADSAFYSSYGLMSVTIGSGVTSIGKNAFYDCYRLVEVYNLSTLAIQKGSSDYGGVAENALDVYTSKDATSKISITDDGYAFYEYDGVAWLIGYTGLETELTLPEQYSGKNYSIYQNAFVICDSLTSVTIGSGVTSIGKDAINRERDFRKIHPKIPNNIENSLQVIA